MLIHSNTTWVPGEAPAAKDEKEGTEKNPQENIDVQIWHVDEATPPNYTVT